MSLRDDLLPVMHDARALIAELGFRPARAAVRTRTWTEAPGIGMSVDVDLQITPDPSVKQLSMREIAASGGTYREGDVRIGPITPAFAGGGYTPEQLRPAGSELVEIIYVIEGPLAGEYHLVQTKFDKALGYYVVARRRITTP